MQTKSQNRQCNIHKQECVAIDMSPQCEAGKRNYCVKCLTNPIKSKNSLSYVDANIHLLKAKKQFKQSKEAQNQLNMTILKELSEELKLLKSQYDSMFNEIFQMINIKIACLEEYQTNLEKKLDDLNIESYLSSANQFASQSQVNQEFQKYCKESLKSMLQETLLISKKNQKNQIMNKYFLPLEQLKRQNKFQKKN